MSSTEPSHIAVREAHADKVGSCNFCNERYPSRVFEVSSSAPGRNLVVRLCGMCAFHLTQALRTIRIGGTRG